MAEKAYYTYDAITSLPDTAVIPCCINPSTVPVSKTIAGSNIRTSVVSPFGMIVPSGDATGATDAAAIQAALDSTGAAHLAPGAYTINTSIILDALYDSISGSGSSTVISASANTFPIIRVVGDSDTTVTHTTIRDLKMIGGTYGIELNYASHANISNVYIREPASHGIYITNTGTNITIHGGHVINGGGSGVWVEGEVAGNGNALSLFGVHLGGCTGHGIHWAGVGLAVHGCCIQGNDDAGIHLGVSPVEANAVSIVGNYLETNGVAAIELEYAALNVSIEGNLITQGDAVPGILLTGNAGNFTDVVVGKSNLFAGSNSSYYINVADKAYHADLYATSRAKINCTNPTQNNLRIRAHRTPQCERFQVSCNADKTGAAPVLMEIKGGTIIHSVVAHVQEAMNGSGTKSFEVGVTGNADAYIDAVDFNPATLDAIWSNTRPTGSNDTIGPGLHLATTNLIATWTNTGGTPSAGIVNVYVTYTSHSGVSSMLTPIAVP